MSIIIDFNERQLIQDLKNGSQQAFDKIYQIYAKRLFSFCLQYVKIREDAEEILQDVFIQLWNGRDNIRHQDTLQSLLFIMAKHHLINAYRKRVNAPQYVDYVEYTSIFSTHDSCRIEYEDFVRKFEKALSEIPPTQREVIILSRLKGFSNQEIALQLSLSMQTVKNQLSLGLKALKLKLGDKSTILLIYFIFY